jgi:hypothetical protein
VRNGGAVDSWERKEGKVDKWCDLEVIRRGGKEGKVNACIVDGLDMHSIPPFRVYAWASYMLVVVDDAWRSRVGWRMIRDSGGAVLLHHLLPLFILLSLPRHRIGRKWYIP